MNPSYEQLEKWLLKAMEEYSMYGSPSDELVKWWHQKSAEAKAARNALARATLTRLTQEEIEALGVDPRRFQ